MTRSLTLRLARFATAGAVAAFAASLAVFHPDAATAAESGFLALVCGLSLAALAIGRDATAATVGGGTLIAAVLCMPAAEGTRGALVGVLLVGAAAWATWRTLSAGRPAALVDLLSLALAWQVLLRSERLLHFEWTARTAIWLVALPLAAATALWWDRRRRAGAASLVPLAALLTLGPGWSVLAVASWVAAVVLSAERPPWWARIAAALACVAAIGWQPASAPALLVLVAALSFQSQAALRWLPAFGALCWVLLGSSLGPPLGQLPWLVALLPVALLAPPAAQPLLAAALALALGPVSAAGPAFALALCSLPEEEAWQRGQARWSLALLAAVTLTTMYPWLRPGPLVFFAGDPVAAVALALLAGLAARLAARARRSGARLAASPSFVVLGTLLVAGFLIGQPRRLAPQPFVLAASQPSWTTSSPPRSARRLTLDTFVIGSAGLEPDRPLARIRLTGADGSERRLEVLHGRHSGDWAARRLGDAAPAPRPWLSWFSADGGLAQRYRASWRLDPSFDLRAVAIERRDTLPPEVEVAVLSVTLR